MVGCSTNNNPVPNPNCPEGFVKRKNKKGEECCYKEHKERKKDKQTKKSAQKSSTKKEEEEIKILPNIEEKDLRVDEKNRHFKHTQPNHDVNPVNWVLPNKSEFINWLTSTFIGYRKVLNNNDSVECDIQSNKMELFPHQRFVRDYLQYKSPYKGLLVYHGLGVGKSCTSIAAAEMLMNFKKVIIMVPAALRTNYVNEIIKCGNKYYDKEKHHWVFVPEGALHFVSKNVSNANKGVWVIDEGKLSNYKNLSNDQKESLAKQIDDVISNNYDILHYNGMDEKYVRDKLYNKNYFDNKVIIIDEAHNFISGVSNESKIKTMLYKLLMNAKGSKIILLTGTPIINKPSEIAYAINLIKGNEVSHILEFTSIGESDIKLLLDKIPYIDTYNVEIAKNRVKIYITLIPKPFVKTSKGVTWRDSQLSEQELIQTIISLFEDKNVNLLSHEEMVFKPLPTKEEEFNKYFVDEDGRMTNPELFMRRIMGSVSHFTNDDPRLYPTRNIVDEEMFMSEYQYEQYINARTEERKLESRRKTTSLFGSLPSVYKTYSRTICNFVFPEGIDRPKPKDVEVEPNQNKDEEYMRRINEALDSLTTEHLTKDLHIYSPKFVRMMDNISKSEGPVLIYSQFSIAEGVELISRVLKNVLNYEELNIKKKDKHWDITLPKNKKPTFVTFKPTENMNKISRIEYTNIILAIYNNDFEKLPINIRTKLNNKSNLRGDILKVLFVTQAGSEGISLKNVRQVHITEPYWNKNRVDQVIGRANRTCSHIALPVADRNFTVYTYTMKFSQSQLDQKNKLVTKYDKRMTTDESIYDIGNRKHKIINQFLTSMQKVAVDCPLNNSGIGCFSFPVDFENKKAYTLDISKDMQDNYTKQNIVNIQKTVRRINIKSLNNRSFIYMISTGELFDNALYVNTGVLNLVGYLKSVDENKYLVTLINKNQ